MPVYILPLAARVMLACALVTVATYVTLRNFDWSHRDNYVLPFMLALPFLFLHFARGRALPADYPACPACHYNLTGNSSGTCPECGHAVMTAPVS
jgi:hypothetical protein